MAKRVQNLLEKFQVLVVKSFSRIFCRVMTLDIIGFFWINFLGQTSFFFKKKVFGREKQSGCYDFDENFGLWNDSRMGTVKIILGLFCGILENLVICYN
jgi:hypothetical protein